MNDFSILICTRNRADKLKNTLDSLVAAIANLPGRNVELVLVNNNSTDHTAQVIDGWAKTVSFPVQNILEKKPGLSAARNAGIRAAKGTIVAFTDDDCTLNPDYLQVLTRYYDADKEPVIRGGRVELGDPTDIAFTILLGTEKKRLQSPMAVPGFIIGANMAIPATILKQTGWFDERFGAGAMYKAGEESDYIYRAYRAGVPVEYVPDLIIQHFHGRKDKAAIAALSTGYFLGGGAMYAKHITDTLLLRHLYWDLKSYARAKLRGERVMDKELGITYDQFMGATLRGMGLYAFNTLTGQNRA